MFKRQGQRGLGAFTLIELLIVVAIIAILAAIAVPNFLEAQIRAQLAHTATGMRTVANAQEAYFVDYSNYINPYVGNAEFAEDPKPEPYHMYMAFLKLEADDEAGEPLTSHNIGKQLTTPVSYLGEIPEDVFWTKMLRGRKITRGQVSYSDIADFSHTFLVKRASVMYGGTNHLEPFPQGPGWASNIPNIQAFAVNFWMISVGPNLAIDQGSVRIANIYDPTNGAVSPGDIQYLAPYGLMGGGFFFRPPEMNFHL